ncbi:rho GTPase-activating protein 23 isoform X5 [Chroicocephalus ridibundus]|uniref:rho GTPase-activating protein 23 isoform X5 n=1 Tax=Chroicocephalus ridibundus TaxID=1192867 RepID=UPI002FDCACE6
MVEESMGGGERGSRRVLRGPPRPPSAPSPVAVVRKGLWSVERAGKGWRLERAVGVDCSSPEPRCIWLSSLRRYAAAPPEHRWPPAPRHGRAPHRTEKCRRPTPGRRDGASPNANAPPEGPFPWVGPKTVVLRKSSQGGFGFTLRHFIVYPPESAVHSTTKEEENGNRAGPPRSRLEPMDTIFVKNVREDGPAHQAGLHTGDRLVKVNGESIIGKTYSQVIALIQNSDDVLELSIMPKDEDILQLAYSQDAYLKGNEPYSGGAQSIPEPPPICYPRKTYPFQSRGAEPPPGQMPDTRAPRPAAAGPSSPLGTATLASTRGEAGGSPAHRPDEPQPGGPPPRPTAPHGHPGSFSRTGCPSNVASSLPDRYGVSPATSSCYGVPKHLPEHRTHCGFKEGVGGLSGAGRPPREASGSQRAPGRQECQQALSRWFCSQEPRRSASEERRHAMPPRYRSVSQDRLGGGSSAAPRGWPHSASHDTLVQPPRESWAPRARSDHYLGRYGRSMEALEPSALLSPRLDRSAWPPERLCRATVTAAGQPVPHSSFAPSSSSSSSSSREPAPVQKHPSQPNLQSADDSGYIGYRSYSPSFQRRTGLLHALSFRDPAFGGLPTFSISQRPAGPLPERVVTAIPPPTGPQPIPAAPREQRPESSRVPEQPEERREEVVLRQKPPTGRKMPPPMRQMNFVFPEGVKETDICDPPPASGKGERLVAERQGRRVAPLAAPEDSLASIPFIDEPTSPSIDLKAKHVPASSVVSSAMNSAPAVATSPSSPTFAFALSRHYSQDCSSIKAGRRSSYLLAITTERSKSCDDGLNAFRDEGKILRRMPSRVPSLRMLRSFFTDGSLDSLGTSEDARSKRHSTSDLSDVPFSAVRKEGWLHCKQILTKKGKKVGGGIRQWKRVFAVLRTHSLYLCKDRREAVTCAPAPGEEEPPISIRACLVDISYSETKRKHVFRLTTADFCEYLFQAEDREDMLAWIKVIRENSKAEGEDPGFASQALINKKLNDYRKVSPAGAKPDSSPKGSRGLGIRAEFLKQTGTSAPRSPRQDAAVTKDESSSQKAPWGINLMKKNKKSVPRAFGVRLEDCQPAPDNKNVPLIVEACCKVVEDRGLEYMGIYRVPGNNAVVSSLQEQLNKGATEINLQDERWQDLNVISSLLKSFFRKLPEPLFTDDKYNDFIEANRIEDASERMRTLRKLIRDLPGHYYETLKFLVGHLKTIADHSEKNKMEPRNLALVFGPTLVRTSEDNMTDMVTHMPDRYKIVETLIQHSDWFFSDKEDKGEKTPVDEKEAQSVPNIEYLLPNIGRTAAPGDAAGSTRSGSAKPKGTWPSRKAPPHRELLAIPFVSAAARKRKKKREAEGVGSSTDDDAERRDTPGREQEDEGTAATLPAPGKAPRGTGGEPAVPSPAGMERESSLEPGGAGSDPAPDARSIVSGYSTLSTMDRSLCSEVQSVAGSRGEEADDERSELSHMETDTESREGARPRMGQVAGGTGDEDKGLPGRPSFNSHRLIQCDTLARRKLGRPRPAGETPAPGGEEQGWVPPGRPSLREQLRQRLRVSADDMGVRLRRAHSPETRRKKSSWRRHTVVVPGGLKDLNFNEWKEPRGLEVAPGPCRDKDSGLSSLESTKARPAATAAAQPGTAGERPATKSPPSSPGPPAPLRFPQCL